MASQGYPCKSLAHPCFGKCFDGLLEALAHRIRAPVSVDSRQELLPAVRQLRSCNIPCTPECPPPSQYLSLGDGESYSVEKEGSLINRDYPDLPLSQINFSYGTMVNLAFPGLQCVHVTPSGAPILIVNGFLSAQECALMIDKTTCELVGSSFVGDDGVRTSRHLRVIKTETPQLQQRIAHLTNHRVANMESIKIIKYEKGDEFSKHYDASSAANLQRMVSLSGQPLPPHTNRELTLFVYLNDVTDGGNTAFYADEWQNEPVLQVRPVQGMAVLFWVSAQPPSGSLPIDDGTWDRYTTPGCMLPYHTMHASLPAVDAKFLMTQWIWPVDVDRDASLPNKPSSLEACPTDGNIF